MASYNDIKGYQRLTRMLAWSSHLFPSIHLLPVLPLLSILARIFNYDIVLCRCLVDEHETWYVEVSLWWFKSEVHEHEIPTQTKVRRGWTLRLGGSCQLIVASAISYLAQILYSHPYPSSQCHHLWMATQLCSHSSFLPRFVLWCKTSSITRSILIQDSYIFTSLAISYM